MIGFEIASQYICLSSYPPPPPPLSLSLSLSYSIQNADSLQRKLRNRPERQNLMQMNILPGKKIPLAKRNYGTLGIHAD